MVFAVRAFLADVFYIPSGSMQPLLEKGDRILVSRTEYAGGGSVRRGDVVVFDGRGSFTPLGEDNVGQALARTANFIGLGTNESIFVKRVIGVGGDTVACCDPHGNVTVNGNAVDEPYVFPGDAPSEIDFEVVVPDGKLWLMGDHRSQSSDSRNLLGAPGGGFVAEERVIGRAVHLVWPFERATDIPRSPNRPSAVLP